METMGLLRVQGPKSNIVEVGDYLHADGPFKDKNDNLDPVPSSRDRWREQLNVETIRMWTISPDIEILSSNQSDGTQSITPVMDVLYFRPTPTKRSFKSFI
jgi:hypothetical protein